MVRVLEGSGRVGVGVDGGRSMEGPEVMVRVGGVGLSEEEERWLETREEPQG